MDNCSVRTMTDSDYNYSVHGETDGQRKPRKYGGRIARETDKLAS